MSIQTQKQIFLHEWDFMKCFDYHLSDPSNPKFPWQWSESSIENFVTSQLIFSRYATNILRKTKDSRYSATVARAILSSGIKIYRHTIEDELRAICLMARCLDLSYQDCISQSLIDKYGFDLFDVDYSSRKTSFLSPTIFGKNDLEVQTLLNSKSFSDGETSSHSKGIFVDTGALIGVYSSGDRNHEKASKIWTDLFTKSSSKIFLSTLVLGEFFDYLAKHWKTSQQRAEASRIALDLIASKRTVILRMFPEDEIETLKLFSYFDSRKNISFADSASMFLVRKYCIPSVFTFDERDFSNNNFEIIS